MPLSHFLVLLLIFFVPAGGCMWSLIVCVGGTQAEASGRLAQGGLIGAS